MAFKLYTLCQYLQLKFYWINVSILDTANHPVADLGFDFTGRDFDNGKIIESADGYMYDIFLFIVFWAFWPY